MSFDFLSRLDFREIFALVGEHVLLVAISTGVAIAIGIPLGIFVTRRTTFKRFVLGFAGVMQTVPSLALFGLLIPLPFIGGIGARTAIIALVLYALLPVVRNTVTGIESVDRSVRDAAEAMGMTDWQILRQVELPLAAPVILAGVRVATVVTVGVATIAAPVGAGGLGMYIFRGMRSNDNVLLLAGAVPAALIALVADWGIGLVESRVGARINRIEQNGDERQLMRRIAWGTLALAAIILVGLFIFARTPTNSSLGGASGGNSFRVGSKDFTESVILAEIVAQGLEATGVRVERRFELGGNLPHTALVSNQIDCYPEYTGTAYTTILGFQPVTDTRVVYDAVRREYAARFDLEVGEPLGFRNDFAILVRGSDARRLNLRAISDARAHAAGWRAGFGQDFMSRADGYAGFSRAYDLRFRSQPREMDLSLTYRALAAGEVDIIAGNSTDGLIASLDLVQLEDDRNYFPPYEAVILFRRAALNDLPTAAREALRRLGGALSTEEMRQLNYAVDHDRRTPAEVVREWRQSEGL